MSSSSGFVPGEKIPHDPRGHLTDSLELDFETPAPYLSTKLRAFSSCLVFCVLPVKIPESPPPLAELLREIPSLERLAHLATLARSTGRRREYLHWDKLRRLRPPGGLTHREWWLTIKLARHDTLQDVGLTDPLGRPFRFSIPEVALKALHAIDRATVGDRGTDGKAGAPGHMPNPKHRNLFLSSSLMEEAITSSQLEGAVTTRQVAADMIRTGRTPRDVSERMILNNYRTMRWIQQLKESELTPDLVFDVHRMVTEDTLKDQTAVERAPRLRKRTSMS
jgi:hypothetical protein